MPDILTQAEAIRIRAELLSLFKPSGPVGQRELFQGRRQEIDRVLSAVSQSGQHVILYGERGVGKTSLARLTHEFWGDFMRDIAGFIALNYPCEPTDTFGTIWANIAEDLEYEYSKRERQLPSGETWGNIFSEVTHQGGTPHSVRRLLDLTSDTFIIVIDEFDRVDDEETVQQFASLIKALSDHLAPSTLILVGVADTVDDLIEEHASIDRATIQVHLPRMSRTELLSIVQNAYDKAGIAAEPDVLNLMARLAQGLPHYAHRLGQEAGFAAVDRNSLTVERQDVDRAVEQAIAHTHESIHTAYLQATVSPQREALFDKVLLACALARTDDLGFFTAASVRTPLERVAGKRYEIPSYVGHLKRFSEAPKGEVLQVAGDHWKKRYRFANPLLRPFVVLRGVRDGMLEMAALSEFDPDEDEPTEPGQSRLL